MKLEAIKKYKNINSIQFHRKTNPNAVQLTLRAPGLDLLSGAAPLRNVSPDAAHFGSKKDAG